MWEKIKNYFKSFFKGNKADFWLLSFFYRGNDFQPPYFWITVFNTFILAILTIRIWAAVISIKNNGFTPDILSDTLVLGTLAFVAGWLTIYNWDRKNQTTKNPEQPQQESTLETVVDATKKIIGKGKPKK